MKLAKPFHTEGGVDMEKVRSRDCESIHVMFCTVAEPSSLLRTCSMKSSQVLSPGIRVLPRDGHISQHCMCDSIPLVLLYRGMSGEDNLFLSYIYSRQKIFSQKLKRI